MTLYEKILTFDVDAMSEFITELICSTEDRMLESVHNQGFSVSLVRLDRELQVSSNKLMLLREVDDGDS